VAIQPIVAHCRHCSGELTLAEVVEEYTGLCPRCGWLLSPDWVTLLLEESRRAEQSQQDLVASLHRLVTLPGNLELTPESVLRNLMEEVDWELALRDDPALAATTVRYLREKLAQWEGLLPTPPRRRSTLAAWARRPALALRRSAMARNGS
jgi:hypothetical protein